MWLLNICNRTLILPALYLICKAYSSPLHFQRRVTSLQPFARDFYCQQTEIQSMSKSQLSLFVFGKDFLTGVFTIPLPDFLGLHLLTMWNLQKDGYMDTLDLGSDINPFTKLRYNLPCFWGVVWRNLMLHPLLLKKKNKLPVGQHCSVFYKIGPADIVNCILECSLLRSIQS